MSEEPGLKRVSNFFLALAQQNKSMAKNIYHGNMKIIGMKHTHCENRLIQLSNYKIEYLK